MSAQKNTDDIDKRIRTGAGVPPLSTDNDKRKGTKGGTYGGITVIRRERNAYAYKLRVRKQATKRKKAADRRSVLVSKREGVLNCKAESNMNCTKLAMIVRKDNA